MTFSPILLRQVSLMSEMYTKHAAKYAEIVKDNIYNAFLERP